jgi:ABC-type nitrate/sulfonate/bicarbonate transport system permease component
MAAGGALKHDDDPSLSKDDVAPAQAGAHIPEPAVMGPRFRGDDGVTKMKGNGVSTADPMPAAGGEAPALLRLYLAHERVILGALIVVLFLIAWEGLERGWWAQALRPLIGSAAERWQLKPIFISSPTLIAQSALRMYFVTGEIWRDLGWSGLGYVLGLATAIAVGIPLGLTAGWYRHFSYAVEPLLTALNATPQVAFLPLIVIWVGTGLGARVLIIFLLAVLPIAINAHAAVRTTDARLIKVAASFGAGDWRLFRTIILPSSLPFLLAGLRLAVGRGMIGVVVGEYGSAAGIGAMISQAGARFQTDKVFVGVLTIVAAGVILVEIIRRIERRVEAWRPPTDDTP